MKISPGIHGGYVSARAYAAGSSRQSQAWHMIQDQQRGWGKKGMGEGSTHCWPWDCSVMGLETARKIANNQRARVSAASTRERERERERERGPTYLLDRQDRCQSRRDILRACTRYVNPRLRVRARASASHAYG